ncbi:ATP-binding protein [Streptomyces sp. NPDC088194]|uniref:ATP-binding protein n=1 Tax=Streptomyces sp. NPDC088194 TaxID=3154931 RepID=UPI00344F4928
MALERAAPRSGSVTTETDALQPSAMRRLACAALDWWGLEALSDDIVLVISELVTNALQHGGGCTGLCLTHNAGGSVRVEVSQRTRCRPRVRRGDAEDERGRGLLIVSTLADAWGVGEAGESVWCMLSAPAGEAS